jgi:hypothetical protein
MFWKVLGGIVAFFLVVALAVMLVATAGLAAVGVAVGSFIDNLDVSTVQVTDADGNTETYEVKDLVSESGRVEVTGDNGERVTIDLDLPQITVQESGDESARVVIGAGRGLEVNSGGPQVRIDGRGFGDFDGHFIARPIAALFHGLFNLAVLTLILVGAWLLLRSRRSEPTEKTVDAAA